MTLETARHIKESRLQPERCKEAEAVLRGGMNICEMTKDGSRKYVWIKVKPTKTDDESSIEAAMMVYQKRKQPSRSLLKNSEKPPQQSVKQPESLQLNTETTKQVVCPKEPNGLFSLLVYLKTKFHEFVKVMDSLVVTDLLEPFMTLVIRPSVVGTT